MKLTKKQKYIYSFLVTKKGYLKKGVEKIKNAIFKQDDFVYPSKDIEIALKKARIDHKKSLSDKLTYSKNKINKEAKDFKGAFTIKPINEIFPWIKTIPNKDNDKISDSKQFKTKHNPKDLSFKKQSFDKNNVIFIPDLHAPFIKEGVLEWILDEQKKYDAGTVIFAGDIIDGHAWSYHEHDVDGMSVGDELEAAKKQLRYWYKTFPEAICLLGNHDLLISRKAKTAGLSRQFIKDFGSIIEAPKEWQFKLEHIRDSVLYHHGSIGDAFKVAKDRRISTCQGHLHSKTFVQWAVSEVDAIFGLQVGWGADRDKYAFDYGKSFVTKPVLSCGLILDCGKTPIVKLMPL